MKILIGDSWKIESNKYGWSVSRRLVAIKGKTKGTAYWSDETYHRTREQALEYIVELEMRENTAVYVADLPATTWAALGAEQQ